VCVCVCVCMCVCVCVCVCMRVFLCLFICSHTSTLLAKFRSLRPPTASCRSGPASCRRALTVLPPTRPEPPMTMTLARLSYPAESAAVAASLLDLDSVRLSSLPRLLRRSRFVRTAGVGPWWIDSSLRRKELTLVAPPTLCYCCIYCWCRMDFSEVKNAPDIEWKRGTRAPA